MDMMASLLLIFILAVVLSIYNYYQLLETKTRELGEQQAQLDAAQIVLAQKETDLETTRVELMGKQEELAAIQIQLDTAEPYRCTPAGAGRTGKGTKQLSDADQRSARCPYSHRA